MISMNCCQPFLVFVFCLFQQRKAITPKQKDIASKRYKTERTAMSKSFIEIWRQMIDEEFRVPRHLVTR